MTDSAAPAPFGHYSPAAVTPDGAIWVSAQLPAGGVSPDSPVAEQTQQALSNVRNHSESNTAHVRVHGHNAANEIALVVEDDGKGLPGTGSAPSIVRKQVPFVVQNGLGLSEMRERASRSGGRIEVDSTVGRTIIRAIIPLSAIGRSRT